MSSPIEPFADNVVIQQEKASQKTASGFIVPESAQEKPKKAKVLAVGPETKYVKVGDTVAYKEGYSDDTIKDGDQEYIIVKEENLRGRLK
jgi:chaperonin GroES